MCFFPVEYIITWSEIFGEIFSEIFSVISFIYTLDKLWSLILYTSWLLCLGMLYLYMKTDFIWTNFNDYKSWWICVSKVILVKVRSFKYLFWWISVCIECTSWINEMRVFCSISSSFSISSSSNDFSGVFFQLWSNFFHCAISFLTQDALQLENFSSSKRQKIISRYDASSCRARLGIKNLNSCHCKWKSSSFYNLWIFFLFVFLFVKSVFVWPSQNIYFFQCS